MKKYIIGFLLGSLLGSTAIALAQNVKTFPDVEANAYYAGAVSKMSNLGVISGYENGNFGPKDYVTRGQVATMFDRYDQTLSLLIEDYCTNHQLKMGMMPTKTFQDLCVNRGYPAYAQPQ